ncbi:MAG: T9SS type A sorting domain-containing protein [bacterium]|nr:T9SS type A sorting domain-containing protein [bacterium]
MRSRVALLLCCALLWIAATGLPSLALNRLMIDGIHGHQNLYGHIEGPYLPVVYPDSRFTIFGVERLPVYNILLEGYTTQSYWDSILFEVPPGADVLYVIVTPETPSPPQPPMYYPFITLTLPDQSSMSGAYGFTHLDDPPPGQYLLYISHLAGVFPYLIGTGPRVFDVYPLDDYDAALEFHNDMYDYWTGDPPRRSEADFASIVAAVDEGMGIGLFYDCGEPLADKPIIHLRDLSHQGVTVQVDVPGRLTLAVPEPDSRWPLEWKVPPTAGDVELDYEVLLRRTLNFLWSAPGSQTVENRSWATLHDAKLISFHEGKGYTICEAGTLSPLSDATAAAGPTLPFAESFAALDRMMRAEALKAGLTPEETESFFARCNWPLRILTRVTREPGRMALYYLDGEDYDALFPVQTDPVPADRKRVLWVYSFLPEHLTAPLSVHQPWASPAAFSPGVTGEYHEYGALRETYGGDALDEMDVWGWHFYDGFLEDTSNAGAQFPEWGTWGSILYHTPGLSPLAAELLAGVTEINGAFTSPISAPGGEVIMSGDNDTYCTPWEAPSCPFPAGSYPPVVVAREAASGARIIAAGDFCFLDSLADNVQFGRNVWDALHSERTENVPDIDVPDAIVDFALLPGETGETMMWIYNRGDAQMQTNFIRPEADWLNVEGPDLRSMPGNDSLAFTLYWSAAGLDPGYYYSQWMLITNDPNEDTLYWPVRLHVLGVAGADVPSSALPAAFELSPPYPNPFNAVTTIRYGLPRACDVRLELFNLMGQKVATLVNGRAEAGYRSVQWNAQNVASGVYICELRAEGNVLSQKLLLMK